MYKLLTDKERQKVAREYSLRRISVAFGLFSTLFLFSAVSLLPSLIFALEKKNAALFTLSAVGSPKREFNKSELESWVEGVRSDISILSAETQRDEPYVLFQKILTRKPENISITALSFNKTNNNKSVRITGSALTRQDLLNFQSSLSESNDWQQVDFPVNAIARDANIAFEINVIPPKTK